MADEITVAAAIKQLHAQLDEAQRDGKEHALRFSVQSVEVELSLVFKNDIEGTRGVKTWFLDVSSETRRNGETPHRVKLSFAPAAPEETRPGLTGTRRAV